MSQATSHYDKEPVPAKTLDEAIYLALFIGPLSEVRERMYKELRNFMSQNLATAHVRLTSGVPAEIVLNELIEDILVREEK